MDTKKSLAVCVTAILYIMLFAVVGSCFMAFKYEDEKVRVNNPDLIVASGISVTDTSTSQTINKLKFSEVKLGLKPVTGELDHETKIPVTVTDQNGSEGIFAKFKVKASSNPVIKIKNISITGNDKLEVDKERKNIWVAIKEIDDSSKNLEDEEVILGTIENASEGKEYTLYFWLSSVASEDFEMCTIDFDVVIE